MHSKAGIGIVEVDTGITEPRSHSCTSSSTGWVTLVRDSLDCSWDLSHIVNEWPD